MARHRDDLLAVTVLSAAAGLSVLLWRSAVFRSFFAWPNGSVWPNFVQAAVWVAGAGFTGWYLRDRMGSGLLGWLNRHHEPHAAKRLEDHHDRLAETIAAQMTEVREILVSVRDRLDGSLWPRPTRRR